MTGSSVAGIITAVSATITALGGFTVSLTLLIPILRKTKVVEASVAEVHTIVNQQRTDAQNYIGALIEELKKHGVDVPGDQAAQSHAG